MSLGVHAELRSSEVACSPFDIRRFYRRVLQGVYPVIFLAPQAADSIRFMTDYMKSIQGIHNVEEVWEEIARYLVYVESREVSLVVLDRGAEFSQTRYMAVAETTRVEDGVLIRTQSNAEPNVEEAIHGVHWQEFD